MPDFLQDKLQTEPVMYWYSQLRGTLGPSKNGCLAREVSARKGLSWLCAGITPAVVQVTSETLSHGMLSNKNN